MAVEILCERRNLFIFDIYEADGGANAASKEVVHSSRNPIGPTADKIRSADIKMYNLPLITIGVKIIYIVSGQSVYGIYYYYLLL